MSRWLAGWTRMPNSTLAGAGICRDTETRFSMHGRRSGAVFLIASGNYEWLEDRPHSDDRPHWERTIPHLDGRSTPGGNLVVVFDCFSSVRRGFSVTSVTPT